MKKINYYIPWAFLAGVCAALGFIPEPSGVLWWLCLGASLAFFVPPAAILIHAIPREKRQDIRRVRNLSLISLIGTMVVLIFNFLSVTAGALWGNILHGLLVIVSVPMVCSRIWFVSLFCWACLLMVCLQYGTERKKKEKK